MFIGQMFFEKYISVVALLVQRWYVFQEGQNFKIATIFIVGRPPGTGYDFQEGQFPDLPS